MRSAYQQVMKIIEQDPQSASSVALAKLILSLHHQSNLPGLRDALNRIEVPSQHLAGVLLAHYIVNGEDFNLTSAGMTLTRLSRRD